MRRLPVALALAVPALFVGCVHRAETCEGRAAETYRHCAHPYRVINEGDPPEPVVGEAAEACRLAYHQALATCAAPAPIPSVSLAPDGGARTRASSR